MKLQIERIVTDEELRVRPYDWQTAYRYAEAMRMGEVFPPIVVGKKDGFYVLLDGWHRLDAAKRIGRTHISALLSRVKPKDFYYEAARLNAKNGRPLTMQERLTVASRLRSEGYSMQAVSRAVLIPVETVTRLLADRAVLDPVDRAVRFIAKAPVAHHRKPDQEEQQARLAAQSQAHLLGQVLDLLRGGFVDLDDDTTMRLLVEIATELHRLGVRPLSETSVA
jgi:hypothetical protein